MTLKEVMSTLEKLGSEQTKKVLIRHGAREPFFGAKIADVKKEIVKRVKKDYKLSLKLYETGNSDAMYLAGLISEPEKMTKDQLQNWVKNAYWYMISEYTVPWVTAESNFALELGLEWIENTQESIASAGWATLSSYISITPDVELDISLFRQLLHRIEKEIHSSPNRVRHTMNAFVIAVGSFVLPLNETSKKIANKIGIVKVNMGDTACKVPFAPDYIKKVEDRGKLGAKRKRTIC